MGAIRESPEPQRDSSGHDASQTAALLAELSRTTDLAWLVERVAQDHLPWVVVPEAALAAWEQRDPVGWAKVAAWLAAKRVTVVRI